MARFRSGLTLAQMRALRALADAGHSSVAIEAATGIPARTVRHHLAKVVRKTQRHCLGCGRGFASRGPFNRLCGACNQAARSMAV